MSKIINVQQNEQKNETATGLCLKKKKKDLVTDSVSELIVKKKLSK